jgi:hypothetical protein
MRLIVVDLIAEICFQALEIFILVLGITGLAISFLLLISPTKTQSISKLFDQKIAVEKKINYLDKPIGTDKLTYQHNIPFGIGLIAGSIFVLIFLFFKLDVVKIVKIFSSPDYAFLLEIIISAMAMVGKIAGVLGFVFGIFLVFVPELMIKIENIMDSWVETESMVDKLDEFHHGIENIILKYPLLFGFTGLMTSAILIMLSVVSLIS